jgi:hypothetical protein
VIWRSHCDHTLANPRSPIFHPILSLLRARFPRLNVRLRFFEDPAHAPDRELDAYVDFSRVPPLPGWSVHDLTAVDEVLLAKKEVNKVTGAIDDFIDEAVDISTSDVGNAHKYARKRLDEAADTLARLADQAIEAAYKEVYKKYIDSYGKLTVGLVEAQTRIASAA